MKTSSDYKIYSDPNRYGACVSNITSSTSLVKCKELIAKIQSEGISIAAADVSFLANIKLSDVPQEDRSAIASAAMIALGASKSANAAVDGSILSFFNKNTDALTELKFTKKSLELLINKIAQAPQPVNGNASQLLKKITKNQHLPASLREKAASICLEKKPDNIHKDVTKAIDRSLLFCNEMPTSATTRILDSFTAPRQTRERGDNKITIDQAKAYYNALKIKLEAGSFTEKDQSVIANIIGVGLRSGQGAQNTENSVENKLKVLTSEYERTYKMPTVYGSLHKITKNTVNKDEKLEIIRGSAKFLKLFTKDVAANNANIEKLIPRHLAILKSADALIITQAPEVMNYIQGIYNNLERNKDSAAVQKIKQDFLPFVRTNFPEIIRGYPQASSSKPPLEVNDNTFIADTCSNINSNTEEENPGSKIRTIEELKSELLSLNPDSGAAKTLASGSSTTTSTSTTPNFPSSVETIEDKLLAIEQAGKFDCTRFSQGAPIEEYSKEQLRAVSKAFLEAEISRDSPEDYGTIFALISRACKIDRGYSPRESQIMATSLLLGKNAAQGRLLQVKTGEGKSLITAMTAASKVFFEKLPVDIITSSSVLAKRDSAEQLDFFDSLGISCSHNCINQNKGVKAAYKNHVVYGDSLHFQADLLRTEFKGEGIKGDRKFGAVLVDEVDSMMIDESAKIAKITTPICGMEHLESMFIFVWKQLEAAALSEHSPITRQALEDKEFAAKLSSDLSQMIAGLLIESRPSDVGLKIVIPKFLNAFVEEQRKVWGASAIKAFLMEENIDYVISKNDDGDEVIAPVDFNATGVVQTNTSWSHGLHQFLQVKHRLRLTPETLTTSFISNMSYFKRYGTNISGMSGTLGSSSERQLLEKIYQLDTVIIPTFKPKRYEAAQDLIAADSTKHIEMITAAAKETAKSGRAVLVISETIAQAGQISALLKEQNYAGRVKEYTRSDLGGDGDGALRGESGDIIVATNLAGRGTDIKTSKQVEEAGGLHVIVAFLPNNLRIEEQAFGRTSRQGNLGSGQMIACGPDVTKKFGNYGVDLALDYNKLEAETISPAGEGKNYTDNCIKRFKEIRDEVEKQRIAKDGEIKVKSLEFSDRLFDEFNKDVYQVLKKRDSNRQKLMQLEDLWGFFLSKSGIQDDKPLTQEELEAKQAETSQGFAAFKAKMFERYQSHHHRVMKNPAYMSNYVLNKLGNDSKYDEPCDLLANPEQFDDVYSYQLHNLRAYAHLRKNATIKEKDKGPEWAAASTSKAIESLNMAMQQIDNVIRPQLQTSMLLLGPESNNSPLHKQLDNKLRLLETAAKQIRENLEYIQSNYRPGENVIKIDDNSLQFYSKLFDGEIHKRDMQEFGNFGMSFLYSTRAKSYSKDYLTGSLVAIAGIAQIVVGAVLALGSAGFLAEFGFSFAAGGIGDVLNGVRAASKGQHIDLGSWVQQKGIELAITLATTGIAYKISPSTGSVSQIRKGAEEAAKKGVAVNLATRIGVELCKQIVISQAVGAISEFAVNKVNKACGHEIKKEVAKIGESIKNRMHEKEVFASISDICRVDEICMDNVQYGLSGNAVYESEYKKSVLSVLDRKSNLLAGITQQLLTSGISTSLSASGYSAAAIGVVKIGSGAVSSAKGIEEINEIKDDLLWNISSESSRVANSLPGFEAVLGKKSRSLGNKEVAEISSKLQAAGVISPIIAGRISASSISSINEGKIGLIGEQVGPSFEGGFEQVATNGSATTTPTRSSAPKPFVFEELGGGGSGNRINLGYLNKDAEEVRRLLQKIAATKDTNYGTRINALADEIAGAVESRMRDLVKSKVVSPVTGALVSSAVGNVVSGVVDYFSDPVQIRLEQKLEHGKISELERLSSELSELTKYLSIGVAAGDDFEDKNKQTYLAEIADKVIYLNAKYQELAKEYPWLAENALSILSYGIKGLAVAASGGTVLGAVVANEAKSQALSYIAGDALSAGVSGGIEAAAQGFIALDPSLSDAQAQSLASAVVLGGLVIHGASSDIKTYGPAILNGLGKPSFKLDRAVTKPDNILLHESSAGNPGGGRVPGPDRSIPTEAGDIHNWIKDGKPGYGVNTQAYIDIKKYDYLFGKVDSSDKNLARSVQNAQQLSKVGVYDNRYGRKLLADHFESIVQDPSNITQVVTKNIKGIDKAFEYRESLFCGPGGCIKFEMSFEIMSDGSRRLVTVIPKG